MKFLLIVLAIHFAGEVIATKRKNKSARDDDRQKSGAAHPAEYELR
jgi:hypothetical protein